MSKWTAWLSDLLVRLARRHLLELLEGRVLTLPARTVRDIAARFKVSENCVRSVELSVRTALLLRLRDLLGVDTSRAEPGQGGGEGDDR